MPNNDLPPVPPLPPVPRTELHFQVEIEHANILYVGYDRKAADEAFEQAIEICQVKALYKVQKYIFPEKVEPPA